MSLVTVFPYEYFCDEQGAFVRAKPLATAELIKSKGWRFVTEESLDVDSLQLSEGGRFHLPSTI